MTTLNLTVNINDDNVARLMVENLLKLSDNPSVLPAAQPHKKDAAAPNYCCDIDFISHSNAF